MANQPAGSLWLQHHLGIKNHRLTHRSYIGTRDKIEVALDGNIDQVYGPKYAPSSENVPEHIEFLLKYDDLNLDFLHTVFLQIDEQELVAYLAKSPSGRYTRMIGYLYEWLTQKDLSLNFEPGGNYIDLLDEENYITGISIKNSRWRINDNLLGTPQFCPMIRQTPAIKAALAIDFKAQIAGLKEAYSAEIFNRATQYLYRKETKSSYEIESEKPSPDRMNRFIAILRQAGERPAAEVLAENNLTKLQNAIVDPRYAQSGYRNFQNYIGQSNYRMVEIYHYICPPPDMVPGMMEALVAVEQKTKGISPVIRATMIAFGFVFIHPFLDGNGRIHRFLIHDVLNRDGLAEGGLIIPVSASMLNNMRGYDEVLEDYSRPLMDRIRFTASGSGEVTVINPGEVAAYFRYPDLTAQSAYLAQIIQLTISHDLSDELFFLERYDELKSELQNLIDMPDKKLNDIIAFLHQNKGVFPNRRKKYFPEITEGEFLAMGNIYAEVFAQE